MSQIGDRSRRGHMRSMAPSEQKERTIAALMALFEGLAKDAPVLALLEDAHWIDPTSLDVFGRLIDRLPGLRALLVITFRPEFAAQWVGRAHVASLQLNRFGRRQALAMVDGVAGGKALPAEVLEEIVAETDGVPLFVEELTKTVLESGLLREENGAYVVDRALTPFAIPSTLQDSLGSARSPCAGVDWATETHQVCIVEAQGGKIIRAFPHGGEGLAELCDWLSEWRSPGWRTVKFRRHADAGPCSGGHRNHQR